MSVAVVIPYRQTDEHRERVLNSIGARWMDEGMQPNVGLIYPEEPWVKAVAVDRALRVVDADVLVIADADVWVPQWRRAVEQVVGRGKAWAIPHTTVHRLNQVATSDVLKGGPLTGALDRPVYRGIAGGGMVVIRRDVYERVPLDGRFVGWGNEDEAWGLALSLLGGKGWRGTGPLWHLWHPPEHDVKLGRFKSQANKRLYEQYARAAATRNNGKRSSITRIVAEGHAETLRLRREHTVADGSGRGH